MCGIFAGVGKLNSNRIVALGSMSEERGSDSVGLGYMSGGEIHIAKIADRPCVGLNLSLRKEVTEAAISGMFIGHTRAATQGAITSDNAHPFLMDGIAFAHNGIIFNDDDFGKYEVDSMSLIHGIKAKNFSKYEGGIALVWIEGGKLNAYCGGNPCYRGRYGMATYLASEKEFLKSIGCTHIKSLAEGMIYTFHSAVDISTKRVAQNKTWAYQKNWQNDSPLANYEKFENGVYKYTPSRFKLNAPQIPENSEGSLTENFNTWSDDRKQLGVKASCEMCGAYTAMADEEMRYCFDCVEYVKSFTNADIPTETKV